MDISSILTAMIGRAMVKFVDSTVEGGANAIAALASRVSANLSEYYIRTYERASLIKTLINRDQPSRLSDIYVTTKVRLDNRKYTDSAFIKILLKNRSCIVAGGAGSGKSMLMRHIFISLMENTDGLIPLFIELRGVNSHPTSDLVSYILKTISSPSGGLDLSTFLSWLKQGRFILCLDGFDEVDIDKRNAIEQQILDLKERFPAAVYLISSREDERFNGWVAFSVFHVCPMEKKDIVKLINRLPYDKGVRDKFVGHVKQDLYNTHSSFLSNPLLATMMLLTFDQFAHIPDKIHIFYEQAFETLFFRHDSSKQAGFRRKHHSNIAIDQFKNCLAAFCASSYVKRQLHFTDSECTSIIRDALAFESIQCDAGAYQKDLLESVCILQRDGLQLTFVHRSFQEYFAALFLIRHPSIAIPDLLDYSINQASDEVVSMAFDMNREMLEREWILPSLRKFSLVLSDKLLNDYYVFSELIGDITLRYYKTAERYTISLTGPAPTANFIFYLGRLYEESQPAFDVGFDQDQEVLKSAFLAFKKVPEDNLNQNEKTIRSGALLEIVKVPKEELHMLEGTSFSRHLHGFRSALVDLMESITMRHDRSIRIAHDFLKPRNPSIALPSK